MKERTLIFFNDTATTEIYTRSLPRRSSDLSSRRRGARPGRSSSRGRRLLRSSRDHLPLVLLDGRVREQPPAHRVHLVRALRSAEHTSELQSRQYLVCSFLHAKISHHLFCLY